MVNYVIYTYATDDVIPETDTASARFTQSLTMSPAQYAEALVVKSLSCGEVHNEYV